MHTLIMQIIQMQTNMVKTINRIIATIPKYDLPVSLVDEEVDVSYIYSIIISNVDS